MLEQVDVTALSTTLATNSIVEGRGHKVGLIALAPWPWWAEQIGHSPFVNVPGSVGVTGEVTVPLDEAACRAAIAQLIEGERCAAIAVAGYVVEMNPSQSNRVRELIHEVSDVPVVCAHEMGRSGNSVDAARAALANARLLPVIQQLLVAVRRTLEEFGIKGRLMVVKGDGTMVDESVASIRPVDTVLSGPAASVSGARILAGLDDALVLDIGGTTTDCAVVHDGQAAVSPNGARVGSWVMSIEAVEITTAGLGGDSRIDFDHEREIVIGPMRSIPFAYLAHEHPSVLRDLSAFDSRKFAGWSDASPLDFLVPSRDGVLDLTPEEHALVDLLQSEGPVSVLKAREALGALWYRMLPTARLERYGMLRRAALTPTDLLHVTGEFTAWNAEASRQALEIFAVLLGKPAPEVLAMARKAVTRRLFEEIIRKEIITEKPNLHHIPDDWAFLLDKAFTPDGAGLGVTMRLRRPLVAIGAPARALLPVLSEHLQTEIVVPEHAEVANAVGAIGGEIVVREEATIRAGRSGYVLHDLEEVLQFGSLELATQKAMDACRGRAERRALEAGAVSPRIACEHRDLTGTVADGSRVFLERRVTATAAARPFQPHVPTPRVYVARQ
jgi:N-methylhydantoinase A/oxoprolinase/acetone carboxylase beta subunit